MTDIKRTFFVSVAAGQNIEHGLKDIKKEYIFQVFKQNNYNQSATARDLGLSRGALRTFLFENQLLNKKG